MNALLSLVNRRVFIFTSTMSAMTSHRILITTEYLNAHFFSVFLFVCTLQDCVRRYFVQIFVNSVERCSSPVYYAPPCISG